MGLVITNWKTRRGAKIKPYGFVSFGFLQKQNLSPKLTHIYNILSYNHIITNQ